MKTKLLSYHSQKVSKEDMQFAAEGRERADVDVEQVADPLPRESGVDVRHID